jgi:hypothetical protein
MLPYNTAKKKKKDSIYSSYWQSRKISHKRTESYLTIWQKRRKNILYILATDSVVNLTTKRNESYLTIRQKEEKSFYIF